MTALDQALKDYLGVRRALGYKLAENGIEVPAKAFRAPTAPAPAQVSRLRQNRVPAVSKLATAERAR